MTTCSPPLRSIRSSVSALLRSALTTSTTRAMSVIPVAAEDRRAAARASSSRRSRSPRHRSPAGTTTRTLPLSPNAQATNVANAVPDPDVALRTRRAAGQVEGDLDRRPSGGRTATPGTGPRATLIAVGGLRRRRQRHAARRRPDVRRLALDRDPGALVEVLRDDPAGRHVRLVVPGGDVDRRPRRRGGPGRSCRSRRS